MTGHTRRAFLAGTGVALSGVAGCLGGGSDYKDGWNRAHVDTESALHGVAALENSALAVGPNGTVVLRQSPGQWALQSEAPGAEQETDIHCAAATDDFERVWYAGSNGLVGMYDSHGDYDDHSNPLGEEKKFVNIAVDGASGGEEVYLVDEEGGITKGSKNKQGHVTWDMKKDPGEGQVLAITFTQDDIGYLCTDSGEAFQNVGQGWDQVGVRHVDSGLTDVAGHEESLLDVASDEGNIYRYNGYGWRVIDVGKHPIDAIARTGRHGLAVSGEGVIYSLARKWHVSTADLPQGLRDATTGTQDGDELCVGDNGFIIYRSK